MITLNQEYFVSIDELLLFNWQKCQGGELAYLRKNMKSKFVPAQGFWNKLRKKKTAFYNEYNDVKAWELVQSDFVERLGIPNKNKEFAQLQVKHTKAILKYLSMDDSNPKKRMLLNDIEHYQEQINAILRTKENTPDNTVERTLLKLSKFAGRTLTTRNTTVLEFHLLIDEYSNHG